MPEALWRISVRFAEAAALPCVQNMRGASIIILSLMLSLIRFRRVVGSAGELKIDGDGGPKRRENNDLEEEDEIIS